MSRNSSLSSTSLRRHGVRKKLSRARSILSVVPARSGDHPATLHFLTTIFHRPSPAEYRATIEDPYYESADRLLVKHGHEVLGHVLLTHRSIGLGGAVVPAAGLQALAVAPDLRGQGFGTLLLRRAERRMIEEGHAVGLLATGIPAFFEQFGWTACGRRNQYSICVCKVLSVLASQGLYPKVHRPLDIRPLRRMEIGQIAEVYRAGAEGQHGPVERTEAYWQWLVNRRAYDELLVAIDGHDGHRVSRGDPRIVGYAVLAGERIVELFTLPDHDKAAVQLLSRACGEAIERGVDTLRIELAPRHPLTRLFEAAGGVHLTGGCRRDEVLMAKVLSPEKMLRRMGSQLRGRAIAAEIPLPLDFGLAVNTQKCRISIDPVARDSDNGLPTLASAVSITSGSIGRSYLRTTPARLTEILLGQVDWASPDRIELSTRLAEQAAAAFFPRQTLWRPMFDDLPAGER